MSAVTRPDVDDLIAWLKLQSEPSGETLAVYQEATDAALELIESRITLPATTGSPASGTSDTNYPQLVRTAILLTAARIAKRSTSPEGVAGFGDLGVVRIMQVDPDVERLISRYLKLDGFY